MQPNDSAPRLVRLNKLLADNGIASRRRADQLIADGEVMVDGRIITELGTKVDPNAQRVEWDGVVLKAGGELHRYYLLNKPTGVVCTNDEKELRRRAWDMITDPEKGRVYPVGRLDVDSSGLIILTNDGEFTHKVTHPSFGIEKTYEVRIAGNVDDNDLDRIRRGLHLSEGKTGGARIVVQGRNDHVTKVAITLTEGKNREVRRVFARFGYKVKELHRVSIGPLKDKGLGIGHWRQLGSEEVEAILAAGTERRTRRPQRPAPKRRDSRSEERKPRSEGRRQTKKGSSPWGR
jgi:23S rRNA pseudouridine2605 synthase